MSGEKLRRLTPLGLSVTLDYSPNLARTRHVRSVRILAVVDPLLVSPIGVVVNGEREVTRGDWSSVTSELRLEDQHAERLLGLIDYSHVIVLGWLHEVPAELRERAIAYPAGDDRLPLQGALALRGGTRPNPLSFTVCELDRIEAASLFVRGLDLVDGSPILDVKPYIAFYDARPDATLPGWAAG
jgi:tRNA-Thr(GGU) m(6)t(6)A37 methyltransferase TsaA